MQEAYLRAYRALGGFRGECRLSTWLVRITATSVEDKDEAMSEKAGPEQDALRGEMRKILEARIDALPDGYRAVFVLRALEEMTVEEAAAVLEIPEATVRTRFFRARALLRESLARDIDRSLEDAFAFAGARCDRIVANVLRKITAGT